MTLEEFKPGRILENEVGDQYEVIRIEEKTGKNVVRVLKRGDTGQGFKKEQYYKYLEDEELENFKVIDEQLYKTK